MTAMKTTMRILTLLIVVVATSCTAPKTVLKNKAVTDSTVTEHVREVRTSVVADTTHTETGETVITEIFFGDSPARTDAAQPVSLSISNGTLSLAGLNGKSVTGIRQKIQRAKNERKASGKKETVTNDTGRKTGVRKKKKGKERKPTPAPAVMNSLGGLLAVLPAVALNVIVFYGIRLYVRKRNEKR